MPRDRQFHACDNMMSPDVKKSSSKDNSDICNDTVLLLPPLVSWGAASITAPG